MSDISTTEMNNGGQNAVPDASSSTEMRAGSSKLLQSEASSENEAQGTGTLLVDVEEVTSITNTYAGGTSLNYAESPLGITGIIKVALMFKNKAPVAMINEQSTLNPKLMLQENVQKTSETWITEKENPRKGVINAFGHSGANGHVFLREITSMRSSEEESSTRLNNVFVMSAHSKDVLQQMARLCSELLKVNIKDAGKPFVENLCCAVNERPSQHLHRLALSFGSIPEASKSLTDFADDSMGWEKLVSYGEASSTDPKLVFIFGGQCSEWYAMGRQLIEYEAVFREAILTVSSLLQDLGMSWSLIDELMAPEDVSRISQQCIAQAATFAVQYATAQLLKSWKVYPSAVLGQSLGEVAAACVAGIITVREAIQIVLTRSTLHDKCSSNGLMAALGISEEDTRELLTELKLSSTLNIAAVNGAKMVSVAGESQSIAALGQHLAMHEDGTFWRVFGTKRAFHSYHMDQVKKPFESAMKHVKLKPQLSQIPVYSTVEGEVISGKQFDSDYWWRNIRCQVKLYAAIKRLLKDGYKQMIEISTQPILARHVKQIALDENQTVPVIMATLPRKSVPVNGQHKWFLQNTVCQLYTLGFSVDWERVQGFPLPKCVCLLHYPRLDNGPLKSDKCFKKQTNPFQKLEMTEPYSDMHCWEAKIDLHSVSNLKDFTLIKGAAYLEMAFDMVREKFANLAGLELGDVKFSGLLKLGNKQLRSLRMHLTKTERVDNAKFCISSVQDDQSKIILSSGIISVNQLQRQENCEDKGASNQVKIEPAVNGLMTEKTPMNRFKEITEEEVWVEIRFYIHSHRWKDSWINLNFD